MHRVFQQITSGVVLLSSALLPSFGSDAVPATVDLFRPVPLQEAARIEAPPERHGVLRQRLLQLDAAALHMVERDRRRAAPDSAKLRIEPFPRATGTFRKESIEAAHRDGYVWTGEEEFGRGEATLVVRGGQVTGHLEIDGRIYRIQPVTGALHRMIEVDVENLPPDGPHPKPKETDATGTRAIRRDVAESRPPRVIVDLFVPYTLQADNAEGDILSDINLAVSLANRAYKNSGARLRLNLRDMMLVAGYDEHAYTYTGTLYNLTGVEGADSDAAGRLLFEPVRDRRDSVGADLVALIREGGSFCGQAWVIETPSQATAVYGYAQVSRGCVSAFTLAHELGHTMGLNHDRYVEPRELNSQYNYGYVLVRQRDRDVMSYPAKCDDAGVTCRRRNLFSNPRKTVDGAPFGIFKGRRGAADGALRLNETRAAISTYQAAVPVQAGSDAVARRLAARP
jgi:hypothetical protein